MKSANLYGYVCVRPRSRAWHVICENTDTLKRNIHLYTTIVSIDNGATRFITNAELRSVDISIDN